MNIDLYLSSSNLFSIIFNLTYSSIIVNFRQNFFSIFIKRQKKSKIIIERQKTSNVSKNIMSDASSQLTLMKTHKWLLTS